ncbi:ATP-binding protein [Streptomyces sp. NPDC015242]|uniref:ATP-binding protein n=1 Tax=Streptomyces sp. NPDC015242 TaxID=3364951 RepID=UPI0036F9FB55
MEAHQLTLSLPATPAAVSAARHEAADAMAGWKAEELNSDVLHTAGLVISELLANAVQHADTDHVSMAVRLIDAALRIEVWDSSPVLPRPRLPDDHSEDGRGLFLVTALTDRYGAKPTPTGKRCWAEIDLTIRPDRETAVSLPLQRS